MANFKTGENKTIDITLTFSAGDEIGNYTQIVVTLFYKKNNTCVKFSRFALDENSANLPAQTFHPLTVSGDVITCQLPAADTDVLSLVCDEQVKVYAEIDLGLESSTESIIKASPLNLQTEPIFIGIMKKSITEGWA